MTAITSRRSTGARALDPIFEQAAAVARPREVVRLIVVFGLEMRRLASEDPAVRVGRLALDILTWNMPAGLLPR